jgi:hypothetical protein
MGTHASAVTWKLGDDYTTDYFVEDDERNRLVVRPQGLVSRRSKG